MKKNLWLIFTLALVLFGACTNERIERGEISGEKQIEHDLKSGASPFLWQYGEPVPGKVIIEISEELLDELEISKLGELQMRSAPSQMKLALNEVKAEKVERLFPIDPRYEGRKRRMGMHLWYIVTVDEHTDMAQAMQVMSGVAGVTHVEYEPVMQPLSDNTAPAYSFLSYQDRTDTYPFNDPRLKEQWHYNNVATISGTKMGADVNLFKAWEVTTGKPEVVVCVVDGGIDITHEDLKANLWVNEAELNGQPGVDDDGNGYVDDIHGYNFARGHATLEPDDDYHGTHVAGTVAAVNNNDIGVCGVAGGNGQEGSGVRLMSGNVFGKGKNTQGGFNAAIVYGADNGAVISQNSWGNQMPGSTPQATRKAIDYFIKYAGCDNDGNQLPNSPMKGGVVIVASGNNNSEEHFSPAEYGPAIAVNAMGPDYRKAGYSNYGEWTDITAPGGDQGAFGNKGGVLSTLQANTYGFYQGTSMACPHVSGVAALAVSAHGGPGFTAQELEEILMAAVLPVDIDEMNPQYAGKLGAGFIDAYAAVTIRNQHKAPAAPEMIPEKSKDDEFFSVTIYWNVPTDEDDGAASKYRLYYSEQELTPSNYTKVGHRAGNASGFISGVGKEAGEEMSFTIKRLKHSTTYYVALVAIDRWGLESSPVFSQAKTRTNHPPRITNLPTEPILLVDVLGSVKQELQVEDAEGHRWSYKLSGDQKGVSASKRGDGTLALTIRNVLEEGLYTLGVTLTDELDSEQKYEIPFRIIQARNPELQTELPNLILGASNEPLTLDLHKYFKPQEFLTLSFTSTSSDGTIVAPTMSDKGVLTLTAYKPGEAVIGVKATNGYKHTDVFFNVKVTEDANRDIYSIWPLPMKKELNVWLNPGIKQAKVTLRALNGRVVMSKNLTPDASGVAKLDVKKLAPGSYQLRIEGGKEPYTQTVLKR